MTNHVIFPARSSRKSVERANSSTVEFEVYTEDKRIEEGFSPRDGVEVGGKKWYAYIAEMTSNQYRDFCLESHIYDQETAKEVARTLFMKFSSSQNIPEIMGVLNITPDSFYPGSRLLGKSLSEIEQLLEQKPDIVDIGGESTRPGSNPIGPEEEMKRIKPILEYVSSSFSIPISLDTRNPETAEFGLQYGIEYLNDVTGFSDPEMMRIAAENGLRCVVMHMRGNPHDMQSDTSYVDLILELNTFFRERISGLIEGGVKPSRIIIDPGIGFGKGLSGNTDIMHNLECLHNGFPVLVGPSRKSFIGRITGDPVEDRLPGTIAATLYLTQKKVDIVRVHDVRENRSALKVYHALSKN